MAKEHRYTVRGHWPFPTDMLRRDLSIAASPEDQALIDRLSTVHAVYSDAFEDVEINLVGASKPNWERWESFCWAVVNNPEVDLLKAERDALKARRMKDAEEQAIIDSALTKLSGRELEVMKSRLEQASHRAH